MSTTPFKLKLEAWPGTDIEDAACAAVRIASLLDCYVSFDFNGVEMHARPGDAPAGIVMGYNTALHSRRTFAFSMNRAAAAAPTKPDGTP